MNFISSGGRYQRVAKGGTEGGREGEGRRKVIGECDARSRGVKALGKD